jgi:hypothetical protein
VTTELGDERTPAAWALLTNHGAVLLYVAEHPDATVRQVGDGVGITERAAARILRDLREASYLHATRIGRRNSYVIDRSQPLRHRAAASARVSDLLSGLLREHELPAAPRSSTAPGLFPRPITRNGASAEDGIPA